jgi:hypothetical protein
MQTPAYTIAAITGMRIVGTGTVIMRSEVFISDSGNGGNSSTNRNGIRTKIKG